MTNIYVNKVEETTVIGSASETQVRDHIQQKQEQPEVPLSQLQAARYNQELHQRPRMVG